MKGRDRVPTIKELAKAAGVSPSTVSIVLGGKAEARKIPQATCDKVLRVARELNYHANVSARRLRVQEGDSPLVVTVYWASDFRALWMVRFLRGLQEAVAACGRRVEIVIHPYQNDRLFESFQAMGFCNAAIICNASAADLLFLEGVAAPVPVVLYNRRSNKYCSVNVEDEELGRIPAREFARHGRKRAAVLTAEATYSGIEVRNRSFESAARQAGMSVEYITRANSMEGGYRGGLALCDLLPRPDCLFCASDSLALGALRAFYKRGVAVPGELEVISVGNGDPDFEAHAHISLSVALLPMEQMAGECLALALELLDGGAGMIRSVTLPVIFVERESSAPHGANGQRI